MVSDGVVWSPMVSCQAAMFSSTVRWTSGDTMTGVPIVRLARTVVLYIHALGFTIKGDTLQ